MRRILTRTGLAVAAIVLGVFLEASAARAQYIQVYSPPVVAPPVVSYYPSTTVYSAPAAVVALGTITTRTFVGYGIFRPRGVYTQSYYTPGAVVAPTTTYYPPVFYR